MLSGLTPFADAKSAFPVLDGCAPASLGRRVGARLLDVGISLTLAAALVLLQLFIQPVIDYGVSALVTQLILLAVSVAITVHYVRTGYLPGGQILGLRQVRVSDGRAPGLAGIGKYLLISAINAVTFGIGPIIVYVLIRGPLNRGWHDVVSGLVVLDVKAGRDPLSSAETAGPARALGEPSDTRLGVVSVGSAAAAPVVVASTDATTLAAPLTHPTIPAAALTLSPATAPTPSPATSVLTVSDGGMITGVPWRNADASVGPLGADEPGVIGRPVSLLAPAPSPVRDDESDRTVVSLDAIALLAAQHTRLLVSDDGQRIPLDKATVVGRNPVAPEGFADARLHSLDDATMSVSKTHAVVGPDPDGVWVQDLRSTNGTAITTPNGMRTAVPAGGRLVAGSGAVVHIGKVAFHVTEQ